MLLFADPRTAYTLAPSAVVPLPDRADVDAAAMKLNPELHQALASLRVSSLDVTAARAAYLPDLLSTSVTESMRCNSPSMGAKG